METQKIKYLENEKIFLDEIKKHLSQFLKGYRLVINKICEKQWTQALKALKLPRNMFSFIKTKLKQSYTQMFMTRISFQK